MYFNNKLRFGGISFLDILKENNIDYKLLDDKLIFRNNAYEMYATELYVGLLLKEIES